MENPPYFDDDPEIEQICRFLNEQLGFTYNLQKKYLINARLNKRMAELRLSGYQAYLTLIKHDYNELNHFFDLLTTNVTGFFRENGQFQILERELLPSLRELAQGTKKIKCWSAGCSSGEEAYTLAIVLNEALEEPWEVKILASDISVRKLREGMAGIYNEGKLSAIPPYLRAKYFQPVAGESGWFQVIPGLRRQIVFRKINLNQQFELPSNLELDCIFCRNVFIYLAKESRERALQGFYRVLKRGGFLFMGQSEPLSVYADSRWSAVKNCIYQKK